MKNVTMAFYAKPSPNAQEFLEFMQRNAPPEVEVVLVDNTAPAEEQEKALEAASVVLPFGAQSRLTMDLI